MKKSHALSKGIYIIIAVVLVIAAIVAGVLYMQWQQPAPKPTLEFWAPFAGQESTLQFFQNMTDVFYNETGIEVTTTFYSGDDYWTKLASSLAGGAPPDIFVVYPGGELDTYVKEGTLADISDLFAQSWAQNQIPDGIKASVTRDGKQYALPNELHTDHVFINSKLFEQYGVDVASWGTSWTWDQFIEACDTFKANNITAVAMSGGASWSLTFPECYIYLRNNGVNNFTDALARESSFEPGYIAAFTVIQDWANGNYFQVGWETQGYMDAYALFSSGQAAMWIQGTWAVGMVSDNDNMTLDVVPFPYFPNQPDAKGVIFGATTNYGVASASKNQAEAKEFLAFLSKPEWQIGYVKATGNPLAQSIDVPEGVYAPTMLEIAAAVADAPLVHIRFGTMCPTELGSYIDEQNLLVLTGQATPQDAAATIEAKATQVIGPVT